MQAKGFIIKLGLRSSTIYVPQYNLVKEVIWNGTASFIDKDRIEMEMKIGEEKVTKEFAKNMSLDVEI